MTLFRSIAKKGEWQSLLGQTEITTDGRILDKVEMSIERLKAFEPEEG